MHGCLGPLIAFAASPDPAAQLRGVQGLRGLSTDAKLRDEIVRRGGLEPLLALTSSQDVEVQMEVLATLCNLSLCGCIGNSPMQFLRSVDIETLISFLCSADTTYRLFAAVTLGNIASDRTLQEEVVEGEADLPMHFMASEAHLAAPCMPVTRA